MKVGDGEMAQQVKLLAVNLMTLGWFPELILSSSDFYTLITTPAYPTQSTYMCNDYKVKYKFTTQGPFSWKYSVCYIQVNISGDWQACVGCPRTHSVDQADLKLAL